MSGRAATLVTVTTMLAGRTRGARLAAGGPPLLGQSCPPC
jgi:hypothetical protein